MIDRQIVHAAVDALLDALERHAPGSATADELVKLRDLPFESAARRALVRDGRLKVVRVGRHLFTSRAAVVALFETLPPARLPGPKPKAAPVDDLAAAARKRAVRRAA